MSKMLMFYFVFQWYTAHVGAQAWKTYAKNQRNHGY